jgi:hypothetical protein
MTRYILAYADDLPLPHVLRVLSCLYGTRCPAPADGRAIVSADHHDQDAIKADLCRVGFFVVKSEVFLTVYRPGLPGQIVAREFHWRKRT